MNIDREVYTAAEVLVRRFMKNPTKEDIQEFAEELQERCEDLARVEDEIE